MHLLKYIALVSFILMASLTFSENSMSAQEMIIEAEQANALAAEVGFEWRDTAKMIAQAKTALADGKEAEAFDLAQSAYEQAVLAKQQGDYMKENWQAYIPR
ncbi:hypothetical protein QWZ13_02530 [Reinekea marina]|uniref:SoxXA-binding protein SoxK n=1 Tax=Reinekea marina TaxID=1310421 RepID=A0ABV7WPZ4_9GAMM|nr:hypothetical protein [Reinekea marina]MDN3647785.1 hypothetical protein [Reinekea marina]